MNETTSTTCPYCKPGEDVIFCSRCFRQDSHPSDVIFYAVLAVVFFFLSVAGIIAIF